MIGNRNGDTMNRPGGQVIERTKPKTKRPSQWNVVIVNDDFTPMVFVVHLLMRVFGKSQADAEALTLEIHQKGKGIAGTYTYEIADTKLLQALEMAAREKHPLQGNLEEVPTV